MTLDKWKQKLDTYLDERFPEMLSLLEDLVNMDSFTHDGADVNRVGDAIALRMRAAGFAVENIAHPPIPEDEAWQAELGNMFTARTHPAAAGPGLAFIGHMDTVFPAGTAAARPFRIDGDRATGPGVADMKAGLVCNMFAAMAIKECKLTDVPLTLVFTPDEELGSPCSLKLYEKQLDGAHAVFCTEPGHPGGGITVERKGSGHMLMEVEGISAHAGRNYQDGASAILELAHKIISLDELLDLEKGVTVNVGLISGGKSANSVAPNASGRVHLTFRTLEQGRELVQAVRQKAEAVIVPRTHTRISGGMRLYPLEPTPQVMKLYGLAEQAAGAFGMEISAQSTAGAAESGYCATALGLPVLCSMGPEGCNLHSPEEYMVLSTMLPRCKLMALTALMAAREFSPS